MKKTLAFLLLFMQSFLFGQVMDHGCREFIEPPEDPELRWLTAALQKSGFQWNKEVRDAYIDYCVKQVAPKLKLSETTWDWFNEHPEIYMAAFSVEWPINPNIFYNFTRLAIAVGHENAEKYPQLLLAYAIRYRNKKIETNRMSGYNKGALESGVRRVAGWFINSFKDPKNHVVSVSDLDEKGQLSGDAGIAKRRQERVNAQYKMNNQKYYEIAAFLKKSNRIKVYELVGRNASEIYGLTGVRLTDDEARRAPWMTIAYNAGRFPPRTSGSYIWENVKLHIDRYEEGQRMKRKMFPMNAPWPLLLMLAVEDDPIDESTFFWNMYKDKGSVPGYSTYTFGYDKPEVVYRDSPWHPNTYVRYLEDGGVCGRLSLLAEFAQRSIGVPAQYMGQPGHRAFLSYNYNHGEGTYSAVQNHSVNFIEVSWSPWLLPRPYGHCFDDVGKTNYFGQLVKGDNEMTQNVRWHSGLCEALNRGQESYEESRMLLNVLKFYPKASMKQKEALLRSGLRLNIANTDIIFNMATLYDGKAKDILRLITAFRNTIVKVEAGISEGRKIKADQDLTRILKDPHVNLRNMKKVTNEWGLFIANQLFIGAFGTIPDVSNPKFKDMWAGEKVMLVRSYANAVTDELKYQKRIDPNSKYTTLLQDLADKYEKTRLASEWQKSQKAHGKNDAKQKEENEW